jgi:F0F1-type ATP synthase membrane subunit b/b'
MTTPSPNHTSLTPLPNLEDLPQTPDGGYRPDAVRDSFDAFRRHALQLQAQLRVLQAAGKSATPDAVGHAVRMDALHLIRAAAEFADTLERDAQSASAAQLRRTEVEVTRRRRELNEREGRIEHYREDSERQRNEILTAAKTEARDLLAKANREAAAEVNEAEARGARLLEQARHQATELTNSARAEVEQILGWARNQAAVVIARAQEGAEQLLGAAGLGTDAVGEVAQAIVEAARSVTDEGRRPAPATEAPPAALEAVDDEPAADEPEADAPAPPVAPPPPVAAVEDESPDDAS